MEENSEVQMETDVSSTTEVVLEAQQVTESHGQVQTIVVVENVKEEVLFEPMECEPVQYFQSSQKNISPDINLNEPLKKMQTPLEISPSMDVLDDKEEELSPRKHDQQLKTYNNKHKLSSKPEQSQLKTDDTHKTLNDKEKSSLNPDQQNTNCKNTSKSTQVQSVIIQRQKSSSKSDEDLNENCNDNKNTSSKTEQPQKIINDIEKSPLTTVQPDICFDKEKPVLKIDQSLKTYHSKHNTQPKSDQKHNTPNNLPTSSFENVKINEPTNTAPDSVQGDKIVPLKVSDKVGEPSDTSIENSAQNSPVEELSKDETKSPLNEHENTTINSSNIDIREENVEVSNSLVENCENENDQMENNSDVDKDHNKNISRELKSLIKSAKESKIISECNQVTSKTRKSRSALDTSLNSSVESGKIQDTRRSSINSQKSNCSEKSEKAPKRSMRSQNPEFVNKVKQFLNSVTGKFQKGESDDEMDVKKEMHYETVISSCKKKKQSENVDLDSTDKSNKLRKDPYCWRCHWAVEQDANDKGHPPMQCTICPRAIHYKCLTSNERNKITAEKNWVCPECLGVLHAESSETRSPAMKKVSLGLLCELLHYALERMKILNGVEPFLQPVDRTVFPDYDSYIVHPMDLSLMKDNITEGAYGSTEAFLADAQWILHNSIIFNTLQSKLTGGARALVRSCKMEMGEIEACPECYAAAHARKPTWFTDVCSTPHVLLWAKLKGFPYWPAKGMTVSSTGMVDVRFFGAHDRAWVPARDCFLFCERDPNNFRSKRQDIFDSMQEAEQHIRNISRKYGQFEYPPFKTPFDPTKVSEQLKMMIPTFDGEIGAPVSKPTSSSPTVSKGKSRSNSKSSKGSGNDGDVSESEDIQESRKMADGVEIALDEDFALEKNKSMETNDNEKETSRKRRRSELEEAVITIMDSSSDKRKKFESDTNIQKEVPKATTETKENEVNTTDSIKTTDVAESEREVPASGDKVVARNNIENEPTATATPAKTTPRVKPIRISLSRDSDNAIAVPKIVKPDKETDKDKNGDRSKSHKRRNSRNKSINGKPDRHEKKTDKDRESKSKGDSDRIEKSNKTNTDSPKAKVRQHDHDTTLTVVAREVTKPNVSCLPTISSVRSLSTAHVTDTNRNASKIADITVTAGSNSSIFIPTSTDNVRNMKEAVNKLQRLRSDTEQPVVGRVGVRAFARMTSPEHQAKRPDNVEIEIKSEPMDFDDADRQVEKMDMMKQFHLRPVNPPGANLREVRINKVLVAPIARKTVSKTPDVRIKAKKTFPQPRKVDDGRSELNSKNSMVYIPIQPPSTQAPVRQTRPITINGTANNQTLRPQVSTTTCLANSIVNTVITPLVPASLNTCAQPSCTTASTASNTVSVTTVTQAPTSVPNVGPTNFVQVSNVCQSANIGQATTVSPVSTTAQLPTVGQLNAIGQVPTNVHTVPLITSVNGQWTFSLQPIMSVGGLDETSSLINGLSDRNTSIAPMSSLPGVQPLQVPALSTLCNISSDNPGEPPRLQQKPLLNPLDPSTPIGCVPPPSTAGPLTAKLNQNAVKLTDFFRTLLEDTLDKIEEPAAQATLLKMQLEHTQWRHVQEMREMKHNHELTIIEMRASYEKDKARAVSEARRTAQVELETAVKATKAKQWCAHCSQEAQFYCCWNTSYCDYPCQKAHWNTHYAHCTQQRNATSNGDNGNSIEKRLQPAPENLPKSTQAPTLTVGNKLTTTRVFAQDNPPQKTSIIVSMMEDHSGNQTMKCVGTYKPTGSSQVSPLIVNKQIMNNEENPKKVVTSGGYLIVGAGSTPLVTPPRRTHTIQYYT